jgi:hypothetical protein
MNFDVALCELKKILGHFWMSITLAWILTDMWPFVNLKKSWSVLPSKVLMVFTCNLNSGFRNYDLGHFSIPITGMDF